MYFVYKKIPSPVGELKLIASAKGLAAVLWENDKLNRVKIETNLEQKDHPILLETEQQLQAYFTRARKNIALPTKI